MSTNSKTTLSHGKQMMIRRTIDETIKESTNSARSMFFNVDDVHRAIVAGLTAGIDMKGVIEQLDKMKTYVSATMTTIHQLKERIRDSKEGTDH